MKIQAFCILFVATLPVTILAHTAGDENVAWEPVPYADQLAHAPRPLPDRIVLTWSGDPATTQAVTWRTDTSIESAVAEIAIAGDLGPKLQSITVSARTEDFVSDLGEAHYHSVNFTALEPATLYAYRVGDGANWSEWFHFRTASREARPFTFIYFGDAQNDIKTHWSRVFRESFRDAPRAAFTLHAGDLIDHANADAEWGEWFGAPAWVNATVPVVPVAGNHEHFKDEANNDARTLSRHWRPQFTLPEKQGAPAGLEETCYYFDYQGTRIISLDSNRLQQEQVEWIRGVLAKNPQRWTILAFHHPMYSPAPDRDNPVLRELWKPVFDEYKVDLVLTGHDHSYARSGNITDREDMNAPAGYEKAYDPAIGTVYVVSVSGPKMYSGEQGDFALRVGEDTQLYQIIEVRRDELHYEARTATGRLFDSFVLRKRDGGPNELIESPAMTASPENP